MKSNLKNLLEIVATANDIFYSKFTHIDTIMGIMDKNLRAQGISADAISIDCILLDKKIVIFIHDEKPDVVDIILGNKKGDIYSSSEYAVSGLSVAVMVDIMQASFIVDSVNHCSD